MSTQFPYSSRGPLLSKWLLRQRSVHNLPSQNRGRNQYPLCKCMLTPTWRGRTNTRTTYWRLRINGSVGSARESNYFTLNEEKLNTQPHDESGSNIHVNTCIDSNSLKVCKLHRGAHFFFLLNLRTAIHWSTSVPLFMPVHKFVVPETSAPTTPQRAVSYNSSPHAL